MTYRLVQRAARSACTVLACLVAMAVLALPTLPWGAKWAGGDAGSSAGDSQSPTRGRNPPVPGRAGFDIGGHPGLVAANAATAQSVLPFDAPWVGYDAGSSAYDGNPDPFERDPTALASADFDGDGQPDVAVANFEFASPGGGTDGTSGFAVLFNQGDAFSAPTHYTVSDKGSWDIAAGDFDEDGDADIVVPVADTFWETGQRIALYLNDGSGAFPVSRSFTVGTAPTGVAVADFDGDGHLDVATSNYQNFQADSSVSVLLGDGAGQFAPAVSYTVDPRAFKLVAGDFDGNGRPDLAVAHDWQQVSVLVNDGSGGFGAPLVYDQFFEFHDAMVHSAVAAADGDGDGDLDLFYSNSDSEPVGSNVPRIVHLRNDGGAFVRATDIMLTNDSAGPSDLALVDFNNDGWIDIADPHGDGVRVTLNDGTGAFAQPTAFPAGERPFALASADVDGDGDADLLTADRASMAVTVHRNPGNGQFPVLAPRHLTGTFSNLHLVAGDIDGDADLDLFASGESTGRPGAVLKNLGDGAFGAPVIITHSSDFGRGASNGKLRDLDGDGDLDILYNDAHTDFFTGYDFWTALNDGNGNFAAPVEWNLDTCGNGDIDAFDLDNDGDRDVVNTEELACATGADKLYIRLNNGDATFQPAYTVQIDIGPHALAGGDFNGDGNIDLVTTHWMPYGLRDYLNVHIGRGDGTFEQEVLYTVGQGPRWIVVEDLNGDGHLDFATANSATDDFGRETLTVLFGAGDGSFGGRTDYYAPYAPDLQGVTGLEAGDVDADGDADLMMTTVANGVAMYYNDGAGGFTSPHRIGAYWDPWSPVFADFDGDAIADLALLVAEPPSGTENAVTLLRGVAASGGVSCADIVRVQARCIARGPRNLLPIRVTLQDASHDGQPLTVSVDGAPRPLVVSGNRAQTLVVDPEPGVHQVELTQPAACLPAVLTLCRAN